jgi:hypothetical protein
VPRAVPAAGAGGRVDVTRATGDGGGKITGLALDALDLTVGDDIDIQMPADLDQFG